MNPPIFVISLSRTPERTARVRAHLAGHGLTEGGDYRIFPAFDGKQLAIDCRHAYLDDHPPEYWETNPPFSPGAGVYALVMSSLACIKYALMMGWNEMFIMEDDVVLCDGFLERYGAVRRAMPAGWGTMHFGWGNVDAGRVKPLNSLVAIGYPLQTECVLYSRKAMEIIDARAQLRAPWDVFLYRKVFPEVPSLICWPDKLATQLSAEGKIPTTL